MEKHDMPSGCSQVLDQPRLLRRILASVALRLDRLPAHVGAVQLQQVESGLLVLPAAQDICQDWRS
jgi:hypothetical protein